MKNKLIDYVRKQYRETWLKNQGDPSRIVSLLDKINPNALLIGFGSFDPRSAAMRIRSACLRPRPSMAWRRHEAKTSTVVGAVFTVFSPSATSTPIMKLNSKFNFARVYHESSILRSKEFNFHCTSRSPHPIGTPHAAARQHAPARPHAAAHPHAPARPTRSLLLM